MSTPKAFPARIHILLAQDALCGVVIRLGPSKRVCTIGWNRTDDAFTIGQWMRGRIYGRRCDLSPDGKHLIYFAMNGQWESEVRGSWTGISRAPYLKAVGLWPNGNCWYGGGLFIDSQKFWLNGSCGHTVLKLPQKLKAVEDFPNHQYYGGECTGVYYLRLQRDGWELIDEIKSGKFEGVTIFEKRMNNDWTLRKFAHATSDHPQGTGCEIVELQDFNNLKFEALEASY